MCIPIRLPVVSAILLCLAASPKADAETFHWVDEKGVMHFTDNLSTIPRGKRAKVQVREDVAISNSSVRGDLNVTHRNADEKAREDQERARQRQQSEAAEEQERKIYQARDKRLKEEQERRAQQDARDLKRRLDTTPVQKSAEELGGFSVSSGST